MGAVLLDPTLRKCLLVRGFSSQASWGFPRGKVAKGEPDVSCAIREVGLSTPVTSKSTESSMKYQL